MLTNVKAPGVNAQSGDRGRYRLFKSMFTVILYADNLQNAVVLFWASAVFVQTPGFFFITNPF